LKNAIRKGKSGKTGSAGKIMETFAVQALETGSNIFSGGQWDEKEIGEEKGVKEER